MLNLEKAEEPEIKSNIHWIIEKAKEFQKNIYFCFIDYAKAFDCVKVTQLRPTLCYPMDCIGLLPHELPRPQY